MKMRIATWVILLASSPLGVAEIRGKLVESAVDGVIEIDVIGREIDRHYLNGAQIVRVFTKEASRDEDGARDSTAVVIASTETEPSSRGNQTGSQGVAYQLTYKTRDEASEAVEKILRELAVATGVRSMGPSRRQAIPGTAPIPKGAPLQE